MPEMNLNTSLLFLFVAVLVGAFGFAYAGVVFEPINALSEALRAAK